MTWYGEPIETFDDVIQPLTNIVGYASKLPKNVGKTSDFDCHFQDYHIDSKIQKYLNNPNNIKRLEHYLDILKKVSDKVIEESFPNENWDDDIFIFPCNRQRLKNLIQDAKEFISEIVNTRKRLAPKTKYCFKCKKNTKLSKFKDALVEYGLIDDTDYFSDIMGENKNNRYINWKTRQSYLNYFIKELLKTGLFEGKEIWEFAINSFTINCLPANQKLRTYNYIKTPQLKKI